MFFPQEFIDRSAEHLFKRSTVRSQMLYSSTLLFFVALISVLPFIHINVGGTARGMVMPVSERVSVISANTGLVDEVFILENQKVTKGQRLLSFQTSAIDQQIEKNTIELERNAQFTKDIEVLINGLHEDNLLNDLLSPLYQSEWGFYIEERRELEYQLNNLEQQFNRAKTLFEKEVISESEFEQNKFELQAQRQRLTLLVQNQLAKWEYSLFTLQKDREALIANEAELHEQRKVYFITAPISGTLQNVMGLSKNSIVHTNQALGEISPDTTLIAELYVSPDDIGLIHEEMPIRFQVDAFNYNEWGFIEGYVKEISNDAVITETGEVLFTIKCTFNKTSLTLANGYSASLKKGMTLQGQFILARRSLFQLLYDNVDDWLNPIRNQAAS